MIFNILNVPHNEIILMYHTLTKTAKDFENKKGSYLLIWVYRVHIFSGAGKSGTWLSGPQGCRQGGGAWGLKPPPPHPTPIFG